MLVAHRLGGGDIGLRVKPGKPARLVRRLLWLIINQTILRKLCNLVLVRILLYVDLLADFNFRRVVLKKGMAYYLRSEYNGCQQAEDIEARSG